MQTVADLATRPQNIETLQNAGTAEPRWTAARHAAVTRAGPSLLGALSRVSFRLLPPLPPPLFLMIIDIYGTLYAKMHKDPTPICAKVNVNGGVGRVWGSSPRNV